MRHNANLLAQRLDEVRPLLLMRRWFVIACSTVALGMFLRVLPGSPAIVTVLCLMALLLFTEKSLVERSSSPAQLDHWLTVFAAAHVVVSTLLLHLAADALWLPIISYAVNIVAGGTALRQRALVGVTAFASASFAVYAGLAIGGVVHPLTVFGGGMAHELATVSEAGGSIAVGLGVVMFVSGFALPALAALAYGMTARLRATRDELQAANADLDAAYGEVVEARRALDRWNAQLNDEVLSKTVAVEEQNRFLTAINAISSALNATIEDAESPLRLGQLIARLLNLDAVQFYAVIEPGEHPMNMVVSASGDIAHAVAPVDVALLRAIAEGGDPIFEAPDEDEPDHGSGELALAVVPLASRDRPLGALALVGARPRGWNDDERRLLRLVGREVGVSFENARLYRSALMARVREAALSNALNVLARDIDHDQAVPQALQLVGDALDGAYVALVRNARGDARASLSEAVQKRDWIDRAALGKAAIAVASLSSDRGHAMLLGPRGESPVSAQMLGRGIGNVVLAPVLATRINDAARGEGGRNSHSYETVGTLVAMAAVGTPWGPAEAEIFERLAGGLARRLESDALVEVQGRRIRELSGLAQLVTRMQATIDPAQLHEGFASAMTNLMRFTDLYLVLLPEEAGPPLLRHYDDSGNARSARALEHVAGQAWSQIDGPTCWALPRSDVPTFLPADARWAIGAPMRARGQSLGMMVVALAERPDTEVVAIAGQAAEQLALALDSALLYRQASDRAARIQVLGQLARIVASAADLREAFGVFAEEVRWLVSFDRALMLLVDESENVLEVYAAYPSAPDIEASGPIEESIAFGPLQSSQPTGFSRIDPERRDADWSLFGADAEEVGMVRVAAGDGTAALFALTRCAPQPFDAADLSTLEEVSSLLAVTLERVKLFEEAEYHALHDALTGLPNLRTLNQAVPDLDSALDAGGEVSVLVIDMDDLKSHNDTFGHERGDEAIRMVAREIAFVCRPSDLVVRSGGDEFVLVMRDSGLEAALEVASRVHQGLLLAAEEVEWPPSSLSVSVGVAVAPTHGRDMRALLRVADQAMYEAKLAGGGATRAPGEGASSALPPSGRRRGERVLEGLIATALWPATTAESTSLQRAQDAAALAARECGLPLETFSTLRFLVAAEAALRLASGPGLAAAAIEALASAVGKGMGTTAGDDGAVLRGLACAAVEVAWRLDETRETSDHEAAALRVSPGLSIEVRGALLAAFRRLAAPEARAA
jgi:diguanylate cyclase (GGDEF)-like protein